MPGIGQVWLTKEELDALIVAGGSTHTKVSDRLWKNIEPKLKAARGALACPVRSQTEVSDDA